jgi:hypothetical protein
MIQKERKKGKDLAFVVFVECVLSSFFGCVVEVIRYENYNTLITFIW